MTIMYVFPCFLFFFPPTLSVEPPASPHRPPHPSGTGHRIIINTMMVGDEETPPTRRR
jgi:hypothetical protein